MILFIERKKGGKQMFLKIKKFLNQFNELSGLITETVLRITKLIIALRLILVLI